MYVIGYCSIINFFNKNDLLFNQIIVENHTVPQLNIIIIVTDSSVKYIKCV